MVVADQGLAVLADQEIAGLTIIAIGPRCGFQATALASVCRITG